jgi:hypothetical protein
MRVKTGGKKEVGVTGIHMIADAKGKRSCVITPGIGGGQSGIAGKFENRQRICIDTENLYLPEIGAKIGERNA